MQTVSIAILDTFGQKMVLKDALASIEIANAFDYKDSSGLRLEWSVDPKYYLKGTKLVNSKQGVFRFSEVE